MRPAQVCTKAVLNLIIFFLISIGLTTSSQARTSAKVICFFEKYWALSVARIKQINIQNLSDDGIKIYYIGSDKKGNQQYRITGLSPQMFDTYKRVIDSPVGQSMHWQYRLLDRSITVTDFESINHRWRSEGFSDFYFESHSPSIKDGKFQEFPVSFLIDGMSEGVIRVANRGIFFKHDLLDHALFWEVLRHVPENRVLKAIQLQTKLMRSIRERLFQIEDPLKLARLEMFQNVVEPQFGES